MKKTRLAVTAALSASVLAGSMLLASPAMAADFYVPDANKGQEEPGVPYPDGWFTGAPGPDTAPVDDETGITLTGMTQLLHGGELVMESGADFAALVDGSAVDADGAAFFQYPIFFDPEDAEDVGFTTLRPADAGTPTADGNWISSWNVDVDGVRLLDQNVPYTLDEIAAAFDAAAVDATPTVLAVGVYVSEGTTALVRSISFAGDNHFFTAEPDAPVVPEPGTDDPTAPVATPVESEATFTG